jgi:hypothetical protein
VVDWGDGWCASRRECGGGCGILVPIYDYI